jgi:membrane protease YdiL (CAAX protease family)
MTKYEAYDEVLKRVAHYSPWKYLTYTVIWTWCFWIPSSMIMSNSAGFQGLTPLEGIGLLLLMQLGAFGPSIMAVIFTARREGWQGVKNLLRKFLIWRVGIGWYTFVLLAPVVFSFGGMMLYKATGGTPSEFNPALWPGMFTAFLIAIPFGPLAEELGWRGFGLPVLQSRTTALKASLILGLVWGLWHLPLIFSPIGTPVSGLPVTPLLVFAFFAQITGISVLYTWMMVKTGGSVLMALLLHAGFNASILYVFFPELGQEAMKHITLWSAIPIWLIALWAIYRYGPSTLSGREKEK